MCINQEERDKLFDAVAKVKYDTGNIRTALEAVNSHLNTLNGRTQKLEGQVEKLEDDEFREVRCVQRETIDNIKNTMLTVERFEAWEKEKERKKKEEQQIQREVDMAGHKRMQVIISAIVGAGMFIISLITLLL